MESSLSDITIAVVLHNEVENIAELWQSFSRVEGISKVDQILLMDNASTDETLVHLYGLRENSPLAERIQVISRSENHLAQARNQALHEARTKYLLFCDADCRPPPSWLSLYLNALEGQSDKVGSYYAGIGGPAQPPLSSLDGKKFRLLTRFWWTHLGSPQALNTGNTMEVNHLPCSNALFVRPILLHHGGFHESLPRVGEDLELGVRLKAQGWHWLFMKKLEVDHLRNFALKSWCRKMFYYGRAQTGIYRLTNKNSIKMLLALVAFSAFLLWLVLAWTKPMAALILLGGYLALTGVQVFYPGGRELSGIPMKIRLCVFGLIPLTHLFYSTGAALAWFSLPSGLASHKIQE